MRLPSIAEIGHQHVGVHAAFEALGQFLEVAQVNPIVFLGEEAGDTIIPPLNDVQGDARKLKSARVAFRYLAGLYLGYNAAIGSDADRSAWLSGLSPRGPWICLLFLDHPL